MRTISKSSEEWKRELTPDVYHVTREKGTERPFMGKYWNTKEKGMYRCSNCGLELFSSDTKFDSGTGWPSFTEPADLENVELVPDNGYGMKRTEVVCKRCGAHLGHVFDDGPIDERLPASRRGKRYCINSCSLAFEKWQGTEKL